MTDKHRYTDVPNKKTHMPFQWNVKQPKYVRFQQFETTNDMAQSTNKWLGKDALSNNVHFNNDQNHQYKAELQKHHAKFGYEKQVLTKQGGTAQPSSRKYIGASSVYMAGQTASAIRMATEAKLSLSN